MEEPFISRRMFVKIRGKYHETIIKIEKPVVKNDGNYSALVVFSNVIKYNANITGADSLNAVECALSYINNICKDSTDPRFYWEEGSPFVGGG